MRAVLRLMAAAVAGATNTPEAVIKFPDFDTRPPAPPPAPVSIRARNVYAWKLRGFEGAPWIELYWTEAERDAAVAACMRFLREHGGPFVYSEMRAYRRL